MGMTSRYTAICYWLSLALVGCSSTSGPAPIRMANSVSAQSNNVSNNGLIRTEIAQANQVAVEAQNSRTSSTPIPALPDSISDGSKSPFMADNPSGVAQSVANQPHVVAYQPPASVGNSQLSSIKSNNGAVFNSRVPNTVILASGESAVPNRDYTEIPKGSFSGETYSVMRGDTLFYIAWISGNDFRSLAAKNNIPEPYHLNVGQVLDVSGGVNKSGSYANVVILEKNTGKSGTQTSHATVPVTQNPTKSTSIRIFDGVPKAVGSNSSSTIASTANKGTDATKTSIDSSSTKTTTTVKVDNAVSSTKGSNTKVASEAPGIAWRWPTEGKIIVRFSAEERGNKGIDISGTRGQPIISAADGRIVYAGNALRGYGNLIIIKHNDDYLSAYAHNDTMLVSEQQDVKAGQKIATMGSSGASSVRLHFEVRYKGRSVNPLLYLPQR